LQAIEAAIEWKLKRVEAGAQGEHKIQRGYLPTPTYSAHYIRDPNFRRAVSDFLRRETAQVGSSGCITVFCEKYDSEDVHE
jgi:predicted N-acyltransferase